MSEMRRTPSPVNGQILPDGKPFKAGDKRASEAGKASVLARKRRADLREMAKAWLEEEVTEDKKGNKYTGAETMIRVAVKELLKGNPRFWELVRDTAGFKPVDKVLVAEVEPAVVAEVESIVQEALNNGSGNADEGQAGEQRKDGDV